MEPFADAVAQRGRAAQRPHRQQTHDDCDDGHRRPQPGPSQALRRRRRDERAGCSSTASRCARAIRTRSDGMGFHGSRRTRGGSDGRIGHCDNSLSMEGESRDSCHLNRSESRPRLSISPAPSANTVRSAFVSHVFPGPVRPDRTGEQKPRALCLHSARVRLSCKRGGGQIGFSAFLSESTHGKEQLAFVMKFITVIITVIKYSISTDWI